MMAAAAAAGQQQAGTGQAQANLTHAGLVGQQLGLPQNQQVSFSRIKVTLSLRGCSTIKGILG